MKTKTLVRLLALLSLLSGLVTAAPLGTAFTYQGQLASGSQAANGLYDFQFTVYDALAVGNVVGGPLTNSAVAVSNGLFTTTLDFGPDVFTGDARWLEIGVRTDGSGAFTTLVPRQALTPAPYALYAASAGSAGSVAAANIVGSIPLAQLPAAVVTNGASDVNISGTFSGNGAGLTGITAASVAIPPGMALIPAGAYTMGDTVDGLSDAVPTNVTVSAFYMDVNLVSWSQWQSVYYWATNHGYGFMNAGLGKAANHPVQTVDWYDCVKWCNARSEQAGKTPVYYTDAGLTQIYTNGEVTVYVNWTASGYRLPTEAEWEKAARGGLSGQRFPWGNVITENLANYYGNTSYSYDLGPNGFNSIGSIGGTSPATSPVGSFAANGYGLYDMAGNIYEWCWDWYGTPYAGGSDPHGPAGPLSVRVLRGGSWKGDALDARCANRFPTIFAPYSDLNLLGFRCVRGL